MANDGLGLSTGGNLDTMSDAELLALAGRLGIDTSPFTIGTMPGPFGGAAGGNNITLSPEVQNQVNQVYDSQRSLGNEELRRSATEAAGARGLNLTDTPISDPYGRQRALFESQLRGNEAGTMLNMSENRFNAAEAGTLNRSKIAEAARQFQSTQSFADRAQKQNFVGNLYDFQQGLAQQAFNNRITNTAQTGLNLNNILSGANTATQGLSVLFG